MTDYGNIYGAYVSRPAVALIIPYFGSWPVYLNTFLKTISAQVSMDVHFVTDLEIPEQDVPNNVFFHEVNFEELKEIISLKMGFEVSLSSPRKLCDFRPAYGYIFTDIVDGYEYWAFGDIDVCYGDVEKFISPMLGSADVISFREDWLSGSLCIFRNKRAVSEVFLKCTRLREYFTTHVHIAFDESCGVYKEISGRGPDAILEYGQLQSFSQLIRQAELNGELMVHRDKVICESLELGGYLRYENGTIKDAGGMEYAYYHYVVEKRYPKFDYFKFNVPDKFFVDRFGFYESCKPRVAPEIFSRLNFVVFRARQRIRPSISAVLRKIIQIFDFRDRV